MRFVDLDSFDLIEMLRPYCSFGDCFDIEDEIEKKVVDVQTVVHAKWEVQDKSGYDNVIFCTSCKYESKIGKESHYCPHCGAKMDGE